MTDSPRATATAQSVNSVRYSVGVMPSPRDDTVILTENDSGGRKITV